MQIIKNVALDHLNTFGVKARTQYFTQIESLEDILELIAWRNNNQAPNLLLGGGSNLLFTRDFEGMVANIQLLGKRIIGEDGTHTYVTVAAGENWHDFVRWTIDKGFAGLENLSLIPGKVGAAPIQNIGAYGVELADHFHSLQAIDLATGESAEYDLQTCQFGYRESFFKSQGLDRLLITSVTFCLPKSPQWKIDYAGVSEILEGQTINAKSISDAVIALRRTKLPDPAVIGNAGSFFKNPVLSNGDWQLIREKHPHIPGYPQAEGGLIKTSAAWLIDQSGWKGYRNGDAGVSEKHALVLVNHGQATGAQIWSLAKNIMTSVEEKFAIRLEPEPRVIGQ